ncbi:collagenase [Bacillus sp. FJAT-29814]|uniref:collagenase n=1 Tax=Bacillus sp. FJAT-29814 TaxID=1729688 RepID=UPI00155FAB96|nr:collagenase [Bacillus sp. FJAT-29814]
MNQDLPFFQSIKMAMTLNYDGEKETQFKEERTIEQYHHISVYYPDDFSELIPITKETLDWAMGKNKELFGAVKEVPIDLIVVQNKDELRELSGLEHIAGFYSDFDKLLAIKYDNKEAILEKKETPLYNFQKSILHEYTHYIFSRMVNNSKGASPYPQWFQEGICEYVGNDQTNVVYSDIKLAPLHELVTQEQWQTARTKGDMDVYKQSYFTIKYLIDTYGVGIVKEIINETNNTGDFDRSFMQATHIGMAEFETNFLGALKTFY